MPKKKKLKLEALHVSSFITDEESRNVKGMTFLATNCADTDCASVIPGNFCEASPDPGTLYVSCNGTCNTCVSCDTCVSCFTCGEPCTNSYTGAVDQFCYDCQ